VGCALPLHSMPVLRAWAHCVRMMNRNIYIRERDMPVWDAAQQYAEAHDRSLSWVLTAALREYLNRHAEQGQDGH
jgi:hypothetical protein